METELKKHSYFLNVSRRPSAMMMRPEWNVWNWPIPNKLITYSSTHFLCQAGYSAEYKFFLY